ncbi:TonB-dependent receptor [Novosphingobium taihuense]|uniref:Iron complex outermembrane receptor protein n=1 Tax=Novosphingobium taihuense TaxID=260085 RepID=A0A7W7AEI6_9SPHN|nr:TonB-dependent receptor [Novosphingobium taihuense]MBB4614820.1 iron complex outermembrane receptor protein [Novosphingobium taihuense]TWH84738.1 iron complex outermembrane receptor protein [Novosphingobium taihuense]
MKRYLKSPSLTVMSIALASTAIALPQVTFAAESEPQAAEEDGGLSVITVTARKREESLLETPIAISALSSQDIEKRGITSVNDVVLNTPGINVSNVNSGRNDRSFQQISLRGMTPSTTTSTLTASFIDGVPVASSTALNAVIDPARIELLKGPQNAYFGRNAFAGAINVVTKSPGKDFGGSISAMGGTRSNFDVSAALEGPIVRDLLSFRITGRAFSKDGSYRNAANRNQTLGDQQTHTGTLQLELTPSSQLTIKAMGMYSEDDDGPSAQGMLSAYEIRANNGSVNIPFRSGNTNGTVIVPGLANCTLNGANPFICGAAPALPAGFSPAQNTLEDALLARILDRTDLRIIDPKKGARGYGLVRQYYHLHLNVDYELGDTGLTLSSLTGYNNEVYSQLADLDNYDSSALRNPVATPTNGLRTYWTFPFLVERRNKDFSQEMRVSYDKGGALKAMLGGSYLDTKSNGALLSVFNEEQFNGTRSAGTLTPPARAETWGIFGSVSYDVTEALNISAEGRWQRDKVYAAVGGRPLTIGAAAASTYGLPSGTFAPLSTFFAKTFDNFMPRVIVNYDVTPDVMVYASWSKAANVSLSSFNTQFLSGSPGEFAAAQGIGLGVIVKPEKLTNYEVGLKGKFLDGRLYVTAAAYVADWTDQHNNRSVIFLDTTVPNAVPSIVSGVANTGKTQVRGFELDINAEPVDGLTINASGAINDSAIRSFADPAITRLTGVTGDGFKGNQLPLTSKYSANLGAQYTGNLGDDSTWFMRADFSYKSRQFVDPANLTWIKGRTQVNARIGFTKGDFGLEGFVTNLFNDKNYTSVAQNNFLEPSFALSSAAFGYLNVGLPELRTFGIRGHYKF